MTSTKVGAAKPSAFSVFRKRNFSLLWSGQLVSTIGSALSSLAGAIYVYAKTGSAMSVSLILIATAAPTFAVGLAAGVFVDRYDRRRIMIASDIARALLVALLPVLLPHGIAWLYVVVALTSAIGQFFTPAHESVLPEVASSEELAAANCFIAISSFGATAVGFAASGLIGSRNVDIAFYLDAMTFLFSAACLYFLRVPRGEANEATTVAVVLENLKAGGRFLMGTPILRSLFLMAIPIYVSFGLVNTLLLPFAKKALGASEAAYGLQEGLTSVGFVAGSLVMAQVMDRLREGQWIAIGVIGMAVFGVSYGLSHSIPVAIAIQMISGFLNSPSSIGTRLVLQRNTPRDMRGRVSSAFAVSRDSMFLVGMGAAGFADVLSVRGLYVAASLLLLGVGLWALVAQGLGQPRAEWRRSLRLLTHAPSIQSLGHGRAAFQSDFDRLLKLVAPLGCLGPRDRIKFLAEASVHEVPAETTLIRAGERGDSAFFILSGRVVVGIEGPAGGYRGISTLTTGDFFGEIAAITGSPRTANVVTGEPTVVVQVPAKTMRHLMAFPTLSRLFLSAISDRMAMLNSTDLPRMAGFDQDSFRQMRVESEAAA
jgi:CRP-like cAMP-binding protein